MELQSLPSEGFAAARLKHGVRKHFFTERHEITLCNVFSIVFYFKPFNLSVKPFMKTKSLELILALNLFKMI